MHLLAVAAHLGGRRQIFHVQFARVTGVQYKESTPDDMLVRATSERLLRLLRFVLHLPSFFFLLFYFFFFHYIPSLSLSLYGLLAREKSHSAFRTRAFRILNSHLARSVRSIDFVLSRPEHPQKTRPIQPERRSTRVRRAR